MLKIFLTVDPVTYRALYDSEATFLGTFNSLNDAEEMLGEKLNFCSIRTGV